MNMDNSVGSVFVTWQQLIYRPRKEGDIKMNLEGYEVEDRNLMADDELNLKYILGLSEISNWIMGLYKPWSFPVIFTLYSCFRYVI